jgi:hypothetical protein
VFTTPTGGPLDPANLTRRFRSFHDRAELGRIRIHDLRHSTATLLLEQGVDLVVIEELLGHAHIGVTASVYAHVRLRLQRQAIETLGDALGPTDDTPDDPTPPMIRPQRQSSADVAVKRHRALIGIAVDQGSVALLPDFGTPIGYHGEIAGTSHPAHSTTTQGQAVD